MVQVPILRIGSQVPLPIVTPSWPRKGLASPVRQCIAPQSNTQALSCVLLSGEYTFA